MLLAAGSVLTMFAGSCLVTTDPEFAPPEQTRPFFIPDSVTPDPRQILVVQPGQPLLLNAFIQSEDAGQPVAQAVLQDYGTLNEANGNPFIDASDQQDEPASSWSAGPRPITATVPIGTLPMNGDGKCHHLTWIISHKFKVDGPFCPKPGDYDTITWTVISCTSASDCPDIDGATPDVTCPTLDEICNPFPPDSTSGGTL